MARLGSRAIWQTLALAAIFRAGLIFFGEWQDLKMNVKYTDIDYWVLSDAASLMLEGKSPFGRATYRYTPLLAAALIPNHIISWNGKLWGKILFSIFDLFAGLLTYRLLRLRIADRTRAIRVAALFWLFNPFTSTISTRGNSESLLITILLLFLYSLMKQRLIISGLCLGLAVHIKIFPAIYIFAVFANLVFGRTRRSIDFTGGTGVATPKSTSLADSKHSPPASPLLRSRLGVVPGSPLRSDASLDSPPILFSHIARPGTPTKITNIRVVATPARRFLNVFIFGMAALAGVLIPTALFYHIYGNDYLQHAILYHVTRRDHRHNFSPYFYPFYTCMDQEKCPGVPPSAELLAFIPQIFLFCAAGLRFGRKDLPFALFIITFMFVTFNKVITSQVRMSFKSDLFLRS